MINQASGALRVDEGYREGNHVFLYKMKPHLLKVCYRLQKFIIHETGSKKVPAKYEENLMCVKIRTVVQNECIRSKARCRNLK